MGNVGAVVVSHEVSSRGYAELGETLQDFGMIRLDAGISGSGVMISEEWLLTAAHVVAGQSNLTVTAGSVSRSSLEIRIHPGWDSTSEVGLRQGSDLALVRIAPLGLDSSPLILADELALGQTALFGGFGRTGNGLVGATLESGLPFGANNTIDRLFATEGGGGLLVTDFDSGFSQHNTLNSHTVARTFYDSGFQNPSLSAEILGEGSSALEMDLFEGTTADGDSGGPLFVYDAEMARWELAGVTSWGTNPLFPSGASRQSSRYGDLSFFTDVTAHREWIFTTIPEPRVVPLLLLAFAILLGKRTRSCRLKD